MPFDVYTNPNPAARQRFPYLLDVQADLLETLETRVVVPLAPREACAEATLTRLMPVLEVEGQELIAFTPQIAAIPRSRLGGHVGNVAGARSEITAALDLLLTGV